MPSPSNGAYAAMISGPKKREEVSSLMQTLRDDLDKNNLLPHQRNAALEQVKIYGRNVQDADPIFAPEGIETLARHGFSNSSPQTSREALRCVANALLLKPATRQVFVNKGFAENAAEKLKCDNADDEFLASRILFLLTYDTNLNFDELMKNNQLGEAIMQNVSRHSKRYKASKKGGPTAQMEDMALSETLKLIFNLTHYYPDYNETFSKCVPDLLKILHQAPIPNPPLQAPVNYLINALLNLDLEDKKSKNWGSSPVFPKFDQKCNVERLINILDRSITAYPESELDQLAAPLVTLLRRIYEFAPESVKKYMQWLLLPTEDERSRPLGRSDTLSSRLLNLSTAAMCPNLRGSISAMLFELSDKDASTFVHNVGYGFASGFLLSHNIAIPENAMEAFSNQGQVDEDGEHAAGKTSAVNPITGQRYEDEEPSTEPSMTMEEKEREAERLFVLFERLKATGVVDIKNPVEDAIRSGRIQELPDDEPPSPD
ncbi:guanine nucleotide exchange factor [Phyllosticta capitalensis]|uniref:Guanine nucleotide exchange factor n=1 Tax=Phyllosticta capitalensis TaxID=121624 RepID=A0ABR1YNE0_9PEZI